MAEILFFCASFYFFILRVTFSVTYCILFQSPSYDNFPAITS